MYLASSSSSNVLMASSLLAATRIGSAPAALHSRGSSSRASAPLASSPPVLGHFSGKRATVCSLNSNNRRSKNLTPPNVLSPTVEEVPLKGLTDEERLNGNNGDDGIRGPYAQRYRDYATGYCSLEGTHVMCSYPSMQSDVNSIHI